MYRVTFGLSARDTSVYDANTGERVSGVVGIEVTPNRPSRSFICLRVPDLTWSLSDEAAAAWAGRLGSARKITAGARSIGFEPGVRLLERNASLEILR
jgi:hypothetical protein